ncbi:MAG: FG-GAP repeat domain-containing protein [Planctomycetota bacterium]|jgi:hypothetical protein
MRRLRLLTLLAWFLGTAPPTPARADDLVRTDSLATPGPVATHAVVDFGDGRADLVTVERDGVVRRWAHVDGGSRLEAHPATIELADPRRALVTFADVLANGGGDQVVAASPTGVHAWSAAAGGGFEPEGVAIGGRATFDLRTGWPRRSSIAPDLNQDGIADLVLPDAGQCHVWLNQPLADGPRLEPVGTFDVPVDRSRRTSARHVSDELRERFTLPALDTRDVNGDGRPDLVLGEEPIQAFHLQRADGTIPAEADVRLDLTRFRDTTPRPESVFGGTAVLSDDAVSYSQDLDDDGIPDYVIAHRRKVWVFHGESTGPQFTRPSKTFMVDEDITYLMLVELDDNDRPDLLIFKIIVPSEAELILGMLGPLRIEIRASGYANLDGRTFESTPSWTRRLELRFPPISKILRNAQQYVEQFIEATKSIPTSRRGDFDGDGTTDVLLVRDEPHRLELWRGTEAERDEPGASWLVRDILFDDEGDVWDFDRMLGLVRRLGDLATASVTRERPPDAVLDLRNDDGLVLRQIAVGDVRDDAAEEILAFYESSDAPRATTIDVLALER